MIGKVYTIEEKTPPLNKAILTAGFFESNNNLCRYAICKFNGINFISDRKEVYNVYYWAELENVAEISDADYREAAKSFTIKTMNFFLSKLDKWGTVTDKVLLHLNEYADLKTLGEEFYKYINEQED